MDAEQSEPTCIVPSAYEHIHDAFRGDSSNRKKRKRLKLDCDKKKKKSRMLTSSNWFSFGPFTLFPRCKQFHLCSLECVQNSFYFFIFFTAACQQALRSLDPFSKQVCLNTHFWGKNKQHLAMSQRAVDSSPSASWS